MERTLSRTTNKTIADITIGLLLPTLWLTWWWAGQQETLALDGALVPYHAHFLGLKPFAAWTLWPFEQGWRWAAGVLTLAVVMRGAGWATEALVLFGVQGSMLLSFIGLSTMVPAPYSPRLGVMLYVATALALLWIIHRRFGGSVTSGLALIVVPLYLLFILGTLASGVLPSVLLLCSGLGVVSVLTLVTCLPNAFESQAL